MKQIFVDRFKPTLSCNNAATDQSDGFELNTFYLDVLRLPKKEKEMSIFSCPLLKRINQAFLKHPRSYLNVSYLNYDPNRNSIIEMSFFQLSLASCRPLQRINHRFFT
jgi:hypothetical protein